MQLLSISRVVQFHVPSLEEYLDYLHSIKKSIVEIENQEFYHDHSQQNNITLVLNYSNDIYQTQRNLLTKSTFSKKEFELIPVSEHPISPGKSNFFVWTRNILAHRDSLEKLMQNFEKEYESDYFKDTVYSVKIYREEIGSLVSSFINWKSDNVYFAHQNSSPILKFEESEILHKERYSLLVKFKIN